jgi:hypothetical protein
VFTIPYIPSGLFEVSESCASPMTAPTNRPLTGLRRMRAKYTTTSSGISMKRSCWKNSGM